MLLLDSRVLRILRLSSVGLINYSFVILSILIFFFYIFSSRQAMKFLIGQEIKLFEHIICWRVLLNLR